MKATVEQINPVQCRVHVEVTSDEVNLAFDAAYRKLQKKASIQGFRPGKAPLGVLRKIYGNSVAAEVHEGLVNSHLFKALDQHTIRPIASPVVESKSVPLQDQAFDFSAVVDVMPKIDFDDYKGVAVEAEKFTVKDETFEREINSLRRRQARTSNVEAGTVAGKNMLAKISHSARLDGIDLPAMRVNDMTVALGQDELYEGLESVVMGMALGEEKDAPITLPADYGDKDLAGKTLDFHIHLTDLKKLDIPELDDELAKDLEFESAEALKARVKEHLQNRADELSRQRLETALLDRVLEAHPFEVPPAMVDQVIDSMIDEMQHRSDAERQQALRNEELRKGFRTTAKRRTQNTLVLWHITQKEKLTVSDDEVMTRVDGTLAQAGITDPRQIASLRKNLEMRLRESLIFEKAMTFLVDNASVTEKPAQI